MSEVPLYSALGGGSQFVQPVAVRCDAAAGTPLCSWFGKNMESPKRVATGEGLMAFKKGWLRWTLSRIFLCFWTAGHYLC